MKWQTVIFALLLPALAHAGDPSAADVALIEKALDATAAPALAKIKQEFPKSTQSHPASQEKKPAPTRATTNSTLLPESDQVPAPDALNGAPTPDMPALTEAAHVAPATTTSTPAAAPAPDRNEVMKQEASRLLKEGMQMVIPVQGGDPAVQIAGARVAAAALRYWKDADQMQRAEHPELSNGEALPQLPTGFEQILMDRKINPPAFLRDFLAGNFRDPIYFLRAAGDRTPYTKSDLARGLALANDDLSDAGVPTEDRTFYDASSSARSVASADPSVDPMNLVSLGDQTAGQTPPTKPRIMRKVQVIRASESVGHQIEVLLAKTALGGHSANWYAWRAMGVLSNEEYPQNIFHVAKRIFERRGIHHPRRRRFVAANY